MYPDTVSSVDLATFVIAVVGLVIATSSLGWQVAAWLLSAGRVRVQLRHGIIGRRGTGLYNVPRSGEPVDVDSIWRHGFTGPEVLAVKVVNWGRGPVTVTRYRLGIPGSSESLVIHRESDNIGPKLPARLEQHESETWAVDMELVRVFVNPSGVVPTRKRRVQMTVELATGARRTTRRALRV
jgi:hypothetical protein